MISDGKFQPSGISGENHGENGEVGFLDAEDEEGYAAL